MDLKYMTKQQNWKPFNKFTSWVLPSTKASLKFPHSNEDLRRPHHYKECSTELLVIGSRCLNIGLNHDECNLRFNRSSKIRASRSAQKNNVEGISTVIPNSVWQNHLEDFSANTGQSSQSLQNNGSAALLNEVIGLIRSRLKGNPYYSVHDLLTSKNTGSPSKELGLELEGQLKENTQRCEFSNVKVPEKHAKCYSEKELVENATSDPQTSYELQLALEMAGKGVDLIAQNVTVNLIVELIEHQHGSYVLQQLIKFSEEVRNLATSHCMTKFESLYDNPFASRVMQLVALCSKEFRLFLFNWLRRNLDKAISSHPAVFLFTNCMGKICSPEELSDVAGLFLREKVTSKMFASRFFKRLLVSFLESSSLQNMNEYVEVNQLDKNVKQLLNDKFGALILFVVIKKGEAKVLRKFLQLLTSDLHGLFRTKFFKFFFYKTAKYAREHNMMLSASLSNSLSKASSVSLAKVLTKADSSMFFVFLILITFPLGSSKFNDFVLEVKHWLTSGNLMPLPLLNLRELLSTDQSQQRRGNTPESSYCYRPVASCTAI